MAMRVVFQIYSAAAEVPPLVAHVPFAVPLFKAVLPRPPTGPVFLTNDDWSAYLVDEDTGAAITR